MSFPMNNLMSSQVGQLINSCLDAIPVVLSTVSFDSTLLKAIVLVLLRDRRTLVMLGDIATLMESNLLIENQNKLEDRLAIYLSD